MEHQPGRDVSLADATERLFAQFDGRVPLARIADVARQARADLAGSVPPAALPELVERLARQRLTEAVDDHHGRGDIV